MTGLKLLLPDQVADLRSLEAALDPSLGFDETCRLIVDRLTAILDSATVLLAPDDGSLRRVAKAGSVPDALEFAAALKASDPLFPTRFELPSTISAGGGTWTCVSLQAASRPMVLLLAGDWTLSQLPLVEHVQRLAALLDRAGAPAPARRVMSAYAFSRRLARAPDFGRLCQLIVDTSAKSVSARKASIAVYDRDEDTLSIRATHGYSALLVQHLRCRPGAGIIGGVFSSGRPLLVGDVEPFGDGAKPRLRYHTRSFISIPIVAGTRTLGVINVADRRDNRQFDRRDLAVLRGLAGVAGLAVDRFLALDEAQRSAHLAAIDPVTGLYNRRYFNARLSEEMERARRQGTPLSVMLLDVDGLKQLNDRLGHATGDAVLRLIGGVLQRSVRLFDTCCRYGGDEFAILMPGSGIESSAQIAERIRTGIEDCRPPSGPWAEDLKVSASIGIAAASGDQGEEEVIARADHALYKAKRDGKNRTNHWPAA